MLSSTQKVASSLHSYMAFFLVFPLILQKEGTQKTLIFNRQLGVTCTPPEIQNFQLFTFFTFRASHRAYASIQRSSKLYLTLCLGLLNGLIFQVVQRRRQSVVCAWGFFLNTQGVLKNKLHRQDCNSYQCSLLSYAWIEMHRSLLFVHIVCLLLFSSFELWMVFYYELWDTEFKESWLTIIA